MAIRAPDGANNVTNFKFQVQHDARVLELRARKPPLLQKPHSEVLLMNIKDHKDVSGYQKSGAQMILRIKSSLTQRSFS